MKTVISIKKALLPALTILSAALAAGLSACGGTGPQTSPAVTTAQVMPEEDAPSLVSEGKAGYTVLLPENSSAALRDAASSLCGDLEKIYGVRFRYTGTRAGLPDGQRLIRLGFQPEDGDAVPYGRWRISVGGNGDLTVTAFSDAALENACGILSVHLRDAKDSGDETGLVTPALEKESKDNSVLSADVPTFFPDRTPSVFYVRGAAGAYSLRFSGCSQDDTAASFEKLASAGYERVSLSENADAVFSVFKKGVTEIILDFWKNTGDMLVIVDEPASRAPLVPVAAQPQTVPKLIDPGQEYDGVLKGMCYILQASDGSFVIVDSGDDDPVFVERIYSLMKANLPDGARPLVRAWLITHPHADHMNGLVRAASEYRDRFDCLSVFCNLPHDRYQTAYENSSYQNRIAKLEKAASSFGADMITARTGQTYYFADIKVTVLGSPDDMFLNAFDDLDETSLILSVEAGSKKLLFSGDSGPLYIGGYLLKRYTAETLKCDFCQASSHGADASACYDYYRLASPDYYLWPADASFYGRHAHNKYIESDTRAKIIYSFRGAFTAELG